jgi:hypothetical protein
MERRALLRKLRCDWDETLVSQFIISSVGDMFQRMDQSREPQHSAPPELPNILVSMAYKYFVPTGLVA